MDKSRVFIASSSRTLLLAEMLRDQLRTDFCEPRLWSQESKLQSGTTIIEMLEGASEESDFAVIILAKDDVMTGGKGETLKARDNCVFEAGLFMAAIGRKRCFLVNSVNQDDLPSDLSGIISMRFEEPPDLTDRSACAEAVSGVASDMKDRMQLEGPSAYHAQLPLLSVEALFNRERPFSNRGDLREDLVIVVDPQPVVDIERVERVRHNLDSGNRYHYIFEFTETAVEKICQTLQMIAWAGVRSATEASDFNTRLATVKKEKDRVLDELRGLCNSAKLRITLLTTPPTFLMRVHNATNPDFARLYAKRSVNTKESVQYALWTEGREAVAVWKNLEEYLETDNYDRLFLPLKYPSFDVEHKEKLDLYLRRPLKRYFPEVEREVGKILAGDKN